MRKTKCPARPKPTAEPLVLLDLPSEILTTIVSRINIETNVSTYAILMRVSIALNGITAPLLYRSILIDPRRSTRFLSRSTANDEKRVSVTKTELLANVRYARFLHFCDFPQARLHSFIREHAIGGLCAHTLHVDAGSYLLDGGSCACVCRISDIGQVVMVEFSWTCLIISGQACRSPLQWLSLGSWSRKGHTFCSVVSWRGAGGGSIMEWAGPLLQPLVEIIVIFINPEKGDQGGSMEAGQTRLSYSERDIGLAGEQIREAVIRGMADQVTIVNSGQDGRMSIQRALRKGCSRAGRRKVGFVSVETFLCRSDVKSILVKEDLVALLMSEPLLGSELHSGDGGDLSEVEDHQYGT